MSGTKMTFWITVFTVTAFLFVGWKLTARGNYETAAYQVIDSDGPFELRDYPEIMLITTGGVLIRTRVDEIREMGRATQGVTLISVGEGNKLSGLQRVMESDAEGAESVEGADAADAAPDADAQPDDSSET